MTLAEHGNGSISIGDAFRYRHGGHGFRSASLHNIGDDADDLSRNTIGDEASAYRVVARKPPTHRGFVDDRNARCTRIVHPAELPALLEGRADRAKIIRRRAGQRNLGIDVRRRWWCAFDGESDHRAAAIKRQHARGSNARDSRQSAQTLLEFSDANPGWLIVFVSFALKDDSERERLLGAETWIDMRQLDKASEQESGTDQQHNRKCDLDHDQR